ncbi:DNA polymerase III subunit gamma and tau [Micromonospora sp. NPDC000089]|uniref:DNA polymerase III subunit gamma and tau n=1 Tax=unclassified Micromonospora TaxID=2617518 RepID=UPI00368B54F8
MTLALYRKYRPRTFAEMIGQEQVTEPLSQALRTGRLNHAYLFSGPRGCGKTSSARILARSLNCEQGPTPEPCGQCESCRGLAPDGGGSIDVIEIDAASHGGVDDARDLREKAFFAPARSRFKIYIIDEAHMVSSAGFNALLKLVEEPPEYVKFIFATTEPEKVLGTIKSRTHHYPFRLFPPKVVRPYLEQLCEAEGVTVEPAVFPLVVRAGAGSMRDSLSVLDQLIAGAGPEGVGYARAAALLGVTDAALIDEMCDALAAGDGAAAYATIDRVAEAGHDSRRFASDLLERLRDLIVLQQVPDAAAKGLIDGPADQIERMAAQAQRLGPATLSRCADIVHNGLVEMRGTTAPRLLLELVCARMLLPGADDSTGGLLQRLERMERRLTLGGADLPPAAAGSAPVTPPPPVRPEPPAPPAAAAAPDPSTAGTPAAAATPDGVTAARAAAAGAGRPSPTPPSAGASGSGSPNPGVPVPGSGAAGTPGEPDSAARARRPVSPAAVMPDPATPPPPRPGSAAPGALDAVAVRRVWPEVVGKVNRTNKRIAALMRDAVVRDLDGDTLVLTVKSTVLAKMMADHAAVLTDALYEELGGRWQIRCEVAGERGGAALSGPPRSQPAAARPAAPPSDARPAASAPAEATDAFSAAPSASAGARTSTSDSSPHAPAETRSARVAPAPAPGSAAATAAGPTNASATQPTRDRAGSVPPAPDGPATDDEDDWPEAARPGGSAAAAEPSDDEDWPEAARPGGTAHADTAGSTSASPGTNGSGHGGTANAPGHGGAAANGGGPGGAGGVSGANGARAGGSAGSDGAGSAGHGQPGARTANPAPAARQPAGGAPVSSAIAAARAAAAGRGGRTGAAARPVADAEWAGEPPYDPDFDGPVRAGAAATPAYEGFDPGDEPLDEVIDEKTARESSEEQAVRLLRDAFGAEKIDEVDAR